MNVLSVEAVVALMTKVRSISGILAEFRRKEEISYHDHCTKSSSQNLKVRTNLIPSLKRIIRRCKKIISNKYRHLLSPNTSVSA